MDPYFAGFGRGKPIGEIMGEIAEQVQKTYEIEKLMKKKHM